MHSDRFNCRTHWVRILVYFAVCVTIGSVFPMDVSHAGRRPGGRQLGGQRRFRPRCRTPQLPCPSRTGSDQKAIPAVAWRDLFNGQSLSGWSKTNFGGEGPIEVVDGAIVMKQGSPMTGLTYAGDDLPRTNYEVSIEAKRLDGIDFFAALTFPVGDTYCSFITSGWAGTVVGLSSIDGFDASDNETTQFMDFEDNRWYELRVRVTPERIQAWVDAERVVDQDIRGRRISTRIETDLSQPLGIAAYETESAVRRIRIRTLAPSETADR